MRSQTMAMLADADLDFTPGGDNRKLGALCVEKGEIEYSYIQSYQGFEQDFSYKNDDPGLERSVARLAEENSKRYRSYGPYNCYLLQ